MSKTTVNGHKKYVIWQRDINYEDWRSDMECDYPDKTDEERYSKAVDMNFEYLGDEHLKLAKVFEGKDVICIGNLQRYNGSHRWYHTLEDTSAEDVLTGRGRDIELVEASVQFSSDSGKYELLECFGHHDDNFNSTFLYVRIKKDGLSDLQNSRIEKIARDYVYEHKLDLGEALKELDTYTVSPAQEIANVYGWKLSKGFHKNKMQSTEQVKTTSVLEK